MRTIPVSLSACLRWEKTEFSLSSDFPSFLPGQTGDTLGSLEILLTQGKGFAVFGNFQSLNLVPPSGDGKRQQVKAGHIIGPGKTDRRRSLCRTVSFFFKGPYLQFGLVVQGLC